MNIQKGTVFTTKDFIWNTPGCHDAVSLVSHAFTIGSRCERTGLTIKDVIYLSMMMVLDVLKRNK